MNKNEIHYKFSEDELIAEFKQYIDKTYGGHYSKNSFQASEFIIDNGHGMGFFYGQCFEVCPKVWKERWI